ILDRMRRLAFLDPAVWDNLHRPGKDAPFKIRGPTYLKDRKKIPAGHSRFVLGALDVIRQPAGLTQPHEHVARFLPSPPLSALGLSGGAVAPASPAPVSASPAPVSASPAPVSASRAPVSTSPAPVSASRAPTSATTSFREAPVSGDAMPR
ncbi:hypothetical protein TSOC_008913, partial [Tetrabaena socialis]